MKKLVSAATSLVMAATMVGAVAPVVASAVDSSKSLSFLAYKDATLPDGVTASGSTVTVSADAIAAGDVVVPVGLYLDEATNDLVTITAGGTVRSDNADVSKIKFTAWTPGKDAYFSENKDFVMADGSVASTNKIVGHAGTFNKRTGYATTGSYQYSAAASQTDAGADNAYVGLVWTGGGKKYSWTGAKSDDYPVVVFDVTLPKGIAEGEYLIDFTDYDSPTSEYRSCLLESTVKYDTSAKTNDLKLNTLTIKVGDAATPGTSATTASTATTGGSAQTTATTAGGSQGSTGTTTAGQYDIPDQNNSKSPMVADADIVFDFTNPNSEDGYWRVDPEFGDCLVEIRMTSKSNVQNITAVTLNLLVEGGFEGEIYLPCEALGENLSTNDSVLGLSVMCPKEDGHGTGINPDNNLLAQMAFIVPDGTPDGLYKVSVNGADKDNVVALDTGTKDALFVPMSVIPGYIAVGDVVTPPTSTATTASAATTATTATTASTASTGASTASTASTAKPTGTGTVVWGDTNCDNQVKINDVVLLNKWLNDNSSYDMKEQGKINADCYDPKDGKGLSIEDSDAIIKSIVHLVELPVRLG